MIIPWWYHRRYEFEVDNPIEITWEKELGNLNLLSDIQMLSSSSFYSTNSSFSSSFSLPTLSYGFIYSFMSSFPRYKMPSYGPQKESCVLISIPSYLSILSKMANSPFHSVINSYPGVDYFNIYESVDSGYFYFIL
jgi:hypothetical protein